VLKEQDTGLDNIPSKPASPLSVEEKMEDEEGNCKTCELQLGLEPGASTGKKAPAQPREHPNANPECLQYFYSLYFYFSKR